MFCCKQLKKEEGIEEYSDEAKIKRLIKANEEKERQIRDKIKNKDFDKENKVQTFD
jgi:hypothetical protein